MRCVGSTRWRGAWRYSGPLLLEYSTRITTVFYQQLYKRGRLLLVVYRFCSLGAATMLLFSGALRNWRKTRKGPDASASGSSVSEAHIKAVTVVKGAKTTRTTTAGGVGHAGAASNAPVPPPRREARASARSAKAPLKLHKVVELCATPSALAEGPASYEVRGWRQRQGSERWCACDLPTTCVLF